MTDLEFDVLDELYFVTGYFDLKESTGIADGLLSKTLVDLVKKGWVNVYKSMDEELESPPETLQSEASKYHFLASKKGLMKHNSR